MFNSYVEFKRAGLRVCPERNELRVKEANITAQAQCIMTLVHFWVSMFHVKFSEKSVGKMNPLGNPCMSAFSRFSLFWIILTLNETLIEIWLIVPWGRGISKLIDYKWTPNRNMVNCSMGPRDFTTCINPQRNSDRNIGNCSMGPGDFITCINRKWNPNRR